MEENETGDDYVIFALGGVEFIMSKENFNTLLKVYSTIKPCYNDKNGNLVVMASSQTQAMLIVSRIVEQIDYDTGVMRGAGDNPPMRTILSSPLPPIMSPQLVNLPPHPQTLMGGMTGSYVGTGSAYATMGIGGGLMNSAAASGMQQTQPPKQPPKKGTLKEHYNTIRDKLGK